MATITKIDKLSTEELKSGEYQTGYKNLDDIIEGIGKGSVITIGARPGIGKSVFGQNIMLNILDKYNLPTLYINLETGNAKILEILLTITNEDYFEKNDKNLYVSDDCFTINELEELLNKNKDIECLFIDFVQLMRIDSEGTIRFNTNEIVNHIKKMARDHNLIIFLISQLSRNLEQREDKRPLLVDLRDSGNLESNSDIVMFLYRDYKYDVKKEDNKYVLEVIVAKNRHGSIGTAYLEFDEVKRTFRDFKYQ